MSYYEDEFIPHEEYDEFQNGNFDNIPDLESESLTSVSTNRKKNRKMYEDSKKLDKGYHKLKSYRSDKNAGIDVYSTVITPGVMIRDAITGARYNQFRVGSTNEHLFFKVGVSYGHTESDNIILFFDNPEQFERHMKTTLSQDVKEKWVINKNKVKPYRN
jgi:hypothetical protein